MYIHLFKSEKAEGSTVYALTRLFWVPLPQLRSNLPNVNSPNLSLPPPLQTSADLESAGDLAGDLETW